MRKHALAATATVAPHLGIVLTVFRILGSFKGCPCGSSEEDRAALFAGALAESLVPLACGLAIGIAAKVAHAEPSARIEPSGNGIDIAASQLATALACRRAKCPALQRGFLDTLPIVTITAKFLAVIVFLPFLFHSFLDWWAFVASITYDGTLTVFCAASSLALLTHFAYKHLADQQQRLDVEMESFFYYEQKAQPSMNDGRAEDKGIH